MGKQRGKSSCAGQPIPIGPGTNWQNLIGMRLECSHALCRYWAAGAEPERRGWICQRPVHHSGLQPERPHLLLQAAALQVLREPGEGRVILLVINGLLGDGVRPSYWEQRCLPAAAQHQRPRGNSLKPCMSKIQRKQPASKSCVNQGRECAHAPGLFRQRSKSSHYSGNQQHPLKNSLTARSLSDGGWPDSPNDGVVEALYQP